MAANARDRLDHADADAHDKQWIGEVDALQQTLRHIDTERAAGAKKKAPFGPPTPSRMAPWQSV